MDLSYASDFVKFEFADGETMVFGDISHELPSYDESFGKLLVIRLGYGWIGEQDFLSESLPERFGASSFGRVSTKLPDGEFTVSRFYGDTIVNCMRPSPVVEEDYEVIKSLGAVGFWEDDGFCIAVSRVYMGLADKVIALLMPGKFRFELSKSFRGDLILRAV